MFVIFFFSLMNARNCANLSFSIARDSLTLKIGTLKISKLINCDHTVFSVSFLIAGNFIGIIGKNVHELVNFVVQN